MSSWLDNLQDASWRGIFFGVVDSAVHRGRRVAVHEYPFRDTVWVEDLGRGVRKLAFRGFLVGDDVAQQERQMLDAAEQAGPGLLVHPTLGSMQVNLVEFSAGQRRELGRVIELEFSFVEFGESLFPTGDTSTQDLVDSAADDADDASALDFNDSSATVLSQGTSVVHQVVTTARPYASLAQQLVGDAGRAAGAVNGLANVIGGQVSLGRYSGGRRPATLPAGVTTSIAGLTSTPARLEASVNGLIASSVATSAAVGAAGAAMLAAASAL